MPDVNVAMDVRTNSLVISADSIESLEMCESLVQRLDDKPQAEPSKATYKLHLFWLIEAGQAADDQAPSAKSATPDARIVEAVNELEAQGFRNVVQAGHAQIVVRSGGEFRVRSTQSLGELVWEGGITESTVRQVELTLDIDVQHDSGETTSLMTEVNTQVDHNVVIGIAGVTPQDRRNAFVIRVEK